jgi:hypothetical protein
MNVILIIIITNLMSVRHMYDIGIGKLSELIAKVHFFYRMMDCFNGSVYFIGSYICGSADVKTSLF